MTTFQDIIRLWPTIQAFSADTGIGYQAARKMLARDAITEIHWGAIVDAAKRRGYRIRRKRGKTTRRESLTLALLAEIAAAKRRPPPANPSRRPLAA